MAKRRRKPKTLRGSNLFWDKRTGNYIWRKVSERTGLRRARSTKTSNLELARKIAAQFDEELRLEDRGLKAYDWRRKVEPLIRDWIAEKRKTLKTKKTADDYEKFIRRAVADLNIKTLAVLDDVGRLDTLVRGLDIPKVRMRRMYQEPLKQFSKWLAVNNRHLPRDPLMNWKPIREPKSQAKPPKRRALMPDEIARALLAAEALDRLYDRSHDQALIFKVILITAPRSGLLVSRDVGDFKKKARRIDYGQGVGNKRAGAGALDPATAAELEAYIGKRKKGPLFLSPEGSRLDGHNLLKDWKEAVSLGVVDALWPKKEEPDLELAWLVARGLLDGAPPVSKGGNPKLMKRATLEALVEKEAKALKLMKKLRANWERGMQGADIHGLRKTHRTWARAAGVPGVMVDVQLGHTEKDDGALSGFLAGSKTGQRYYTDLDSKVFDPARSAVAVRTMLDEALGKARAVKPSPVAYHLAYGGDDRGKATG